MSSRQEASSPASKDILSSLGAEAKFFATPDCKGGYWQIALVAFLTEWGAMTYLRAPMGLTSSGTFSATEQTVHAVSPDKKRNEILTRAYSFTNLI